MYACDDVCLSVLHPWFAERAAACVGGRCEASPRSPRLLSVCLSLFVASDTGHTGATAAGSSGAALRTVSVCLPSLPAHAAVKVRCVYLQCLALLH